MTMSTQTPMLRQYQELKRQHPGTLLFFRLGDFYELFFDDAVIGSRELQITLTARHKERGDRVPMCGVPHHSAANYIARLVRKGYRVAICEQTEEASKTKKLVRREGLVTLWNLPDVWNYKEQKGFPIGYNFPTSGTPVITDGIAVLRGAQHEAEAKRFYEFVTTSEALVLAAKKYYRVPVRTDVDRSQLPAWMNEKVNAMPLDWNVLRKQSGEWLRYWDTEIRDHNKQ